MFITEYFITQFVIFLTYVPDEANYMNLNIKQNKKNYLWYKNLQKFSTMDCID